MIPLLIVVAIWLTALLVPVTFLQVLYLESLRLRSRELPALGFFKETIEDRIGLKAERGTLTFSLIKHTIIALEGVAFLGIAAERGSLTWPALVEGAAAAWLVMMGAAYVVPQTLYRKTTGRWLLPLVPLLRLLAFTVRPLIWLLAFFQSVVELGEPEKETEEGTNHAEHIDALISAGAEEGLIEEEDRRLIQAAVAFGDKTVREVMTARPNIVGIEASQPLEELRKLVINEQFSRIPIFEETIDNVIGFVHVRDMFELEEEEREHRTVRELMRPVRLVPETKRVNDLLREMQEDRAHVAIVVDEYGNTAGLVTMEDLVEEILGEIRDEHEPELDVVPEANGAYIVAGSCDLDRLHELLDFRPEEGTTSTTVGGLVAEWLGRVPRVGEAVERNGIRMEVLAGNELRVEQVRVTRVGSAEHA